MAIFSHAAQDNHDRLAYGVQRVFEVALLVGAATAVALVLGAPIAVRVIGGPRFAPSASILQIQAIGLTLSFVNAVWVYAMLSLGLTRDIMRINLGLMVVGGALVAALAAADGTHGAAIATSVSELGFAVAQVVVLTRATPGGGPPCGRCRSSPWLRLSGWRPCSSPI